MSDVVRVQARALRDSGRALLVHLEDVGEDAWVPHSVIDDDSEVYAEGHAGELVVQGWFGRKEGWE